MIRSRTIFSALAALTMCAASTVSAQPSQDRTLRIQPATGPLAGKEIYRASHALLVGINEYPKLPRDRWLEFTANDVLKLREVLIRSYGFPSSNVRVLLNEEATKANIEGALASMADDRKVGDKDRILVYFSCHGQTVRQASGREAGFLIPHDAAVDLDRPQNAAPYLASCIAMETVWSYLESSPAKHILVVADACYSGLLARSRALEPLNPSALAAIASKRALQVITAGQKGQVSVENPRWGHGAFTYKLLEELRANAAEPDHILTASDLFASLQRSVTNLTDGKQTPQKGDRETEGDFLFISTAPAPVPPFQIADSGLPRAKGTLEEARKLLEEFLSPSADHSRLSSALRPTAADYDRVFFSEFSGKARAYWEPGWESGTLAVSAWTPDEVAAGRPPKQLLLSSAKIEDLKKWIPEARKDFPGGYERAAHYFRDGLTIYRFKFVKPNESLGFAYDGLVCVNGYWRIFPKPWRMIVD